MFLSARQAAATLAGRAGRTSTTSTRPSGRTVISARSLKKTYADGGDAFLAKF